MTTDSPPPPAPGPLPHAAAGLDVALALVGDRWSLLVIHALLGGARRFNDLLEDIPGLAPNVLSHRLKHLERETLLVATPYSRRPPRFRYQLTAAGGELADALRILARWGGSHAGDDAGDAGHDPGPAHSLCGTALEIRWYCPTCGRVVEDDESDALHHF
ncbi:MAG TPA: helix-turn-helix domain-containing protein [Acidimicrobiales bacterium]|nr:helix-turn-helix domain-containing protein [Acidimicrobiales bacterium]